MDVSRSYHRSLIRLVIVNALIKPIWILGIDRWVQNEVGASAYGSYFSLWGLTLTAGFLLDLGLSTIVQRAAADPRATPSSLAGLFWIKGLLLSLYLLAIGLISCLHPDLPTGWIWGLAGIQALNSFYVYLRAWVTAAQDFASDVWFSVLDKIFLIPICLLWLSGSLSLWAIRLDIFIALQLGSLLISIGVLGLYFIRKRIRLVGPFTLPLTQLRQAWPYALIVLLMSAHTRLDGYWLYTWSSVEEAGRFAAGFRLWEGVNMFGYLVASFLLPYLSRHSSDIVLVRTALRNARQGLLFLAVFLMLFARWQAPVLAELLYPASATAVASLFPYVFGCWVGYTLVHVYGTALTARGDLFFFVSVLTGALLLHVLLSAWWIPDMGAMGSVRAALVSQVLAGSALMYGVHRRIGGPQPLPSYLVIIFTACLIWFFTS